MSMIPTPAVPRRVLPVFAGTIWGLVGLMLCTRATLWLAAADPLPTAGALAAGLLLGAFMIRFAFRPLVARNLERLAERPERTCLFAMFPWRSWAIALVMSVLGVMLRRSGFPRLPLAGMYVGMGLSLLSGAFLYYRHVLGRRTR